mmetsp:Transcript_26493/g.81539  ORF Transcript_26493/g.81539 Transcript_26493/m.81539 type:complete len:264 (-) Transcript_26493:82-873(-)
MQRCRDCWPWARGAAANTQALSTSAAAGASGEDEEEMLEYRVRVDGFEFARRTRHVIYSITVFRGDAHWPIRRRFRQVATLHNQLLQGLGRSAIKDGLPRLPPRVTCRSVWHGPHDERFLSARAARLQRYFEALLRYIPYVDHCEALHEFLCSVDVSLMSYDALYDLGQAIGRAGGNAPAVDPAAIAALPRRSAEAEAAGAVPVPCRCVICQDALEADEDVRVLPCGHEYHYGCIAKWILQSNTCCVCQGLAVVPAPSQPSEK